MKKFDLGFVDLDDTLYDTKKFKEDIYEVFKPFGIGHDDFIAAYRRAAELPELGYFHYTFEKQVEAVRETGFNIPDSVIAQLENLLKQDYIIPDAVDFLKFFRKCCSYTVLLTAGTKDFQMKKIEAINAASLVDEIVQIDGGKDDVLRPLAKDKKILFINDNLDENIMIKNKFPEITILTRFNPSYWTKEDCEKSGLPCFRTLTDIKNYVAKL